MRESIHLYFMSIAEAVATRATCDRAHVGVLIVRDKNILATGFNGSISGDDHCDKVGHMMVDNHCVRTIHAEINAVLQAAKNGTAIKGADIYVTTFPCWECFKVLANAGIKNIYFKDEYRVNMTVLDVARKLGVKFYKVDESLHDKVISFGVFK